MKWRNNSHFQLFLFFLKGDLAEDFLHSLCTKGPQAKRHLVWLYSWRVRQPLELTRLKRENVSLAITSCFIKALTGRFRWYKQTNDIIYFEDFQERLSAWDDVDYFGLAGLTLRKAQTECFVISLTQKCDHEKTKKRKYLEFH